MTSSVSADRFPPPVTALVTGSTNGIGHVVARRLLAEGATVIVHGPSAEQVEAARERLLMAGLPAGRIESAVADFRHLPSVIELAARIAARHRRLDVLVNNAGVAGGESRIVTGDGHELAHQVNYLAPYLLTRLLWAPLCAAERGRVVNVSSVMHRTGNFDWADLEGARHYSATGVYAKSKLQLTMFTRALAAVSAAAGERLEAVSVHPGVVASGLLPLYARTGAPVAEGAEAVLRLCDRAHPVDGGAYYDRGVEAPPAALVGNDKAVARLWKATAKLVGFDEVTSPGRAPVPADA